MALKIEGSNPFTHPINLTPIAQRIERRPSELLIKQRLVGVLFCCRLSGNSEVNTHHGKDY